MAKCNSKRKLLATDLYRDGLLWSINVCFYMIENLIPSTPVECHQQKKEGILSP